METVDQIDNFDVVVVGAGVFGLSCGYQLTKRAQKVLILEQVAH